MKYMVAGGERRDTACKRISIQLGARFGVSRFRAGHTLRRLASELW
jgi:hypothetical protein